MTSRVLAEHWARGTTPLIRSDFSNDQAWAQVATEVTKEVDFADELGEEAGPPYAPNIAPVDSRDFEGTTAESLLRSRPKEAVGYVLLADARSMQEAMSGGELTVVYLDLSLTDEDAAEFGMTYGRSIRCAASEVASIECNLAIANMEFEEFANSADPDGVFRGYST